MDLQRFRSLSAHNQALVAIAVLLDGHEADVYLENDAVHGSGLQKAAQELASQKPEVRMPLLGTLLRSANEELK